MKQSTSFAQVANNLLNVLQGYTKGIRFLAVLTMLFTLGVGSMWGAEEVYKETIFNSSNNSGKISSYSNSWSNTTNSFKVNITNANNNNNGWAYIKMGSSSSASTGTIITASSIDKKITKVSLNIGAITYTNVTSIKLYKSTNNSTWVEIGSFSKSTNWQNVVISDANQGTNLYYKIEAVCTKASKNGPLQINGLRFYIEDTPVQSYTVSWTINPAEGGRLSAETGNSITVTPNAAYTYGNPACTVSPAGKAKVFQSTNTFTATPTENCTIQINMVEKPKYTVTLVPGSGSVTDTELEEESAGAGVTLPTPTLVGCNEWSFAGWKTTSAVATETTTKPTLIAAGTYKPTSNINLYAVYQRTETTEGTPTVTTTTDKLTRETTDVAKNSTSYSNWSGKKVTSSAVYAGNSAGGNDAIQLRSNNSNSGIVTTTSGGKAKKVTVVWQSSTADDRTLDIYGKNSAYSAATDLYNTSTQGTKLGSIAKGSTTLTITGDYEYIGLRSNSGAMYLTSISIEWETTSGGGSTTTTYYHSTPDCGSQTDCSSLTFANNIAANHTATYTQNAPATELTVVASLMGATYQWYSNTTNSTTSGTAIDGATNSRFQPLTSVIGTTYYYCVATYNECTIKSNVATIVVNAQIYTITIDNNIQYGIVEADKFSAEEGETVKLTITPTSGYKLETITVTKNGGGIVEVQNNQFTMPASNVTVSATFDAIPQLDTPTNLQVTNITCTGATLSWGNVTNNNGYTLSITNTSSSQTFNSTIAKNETSGTPPLNPGITYTWKVVAKGDGTNYNDSEVADGGSFTTNYKITYDVKGGSWTACADGCVAGGEDFTICSTVPTKTGYNFMGWSTADDQIAEYQAEETIENVSANTTLYAVWEQKKYTVNWYVNGTSSANKQMLRVLL